MKQPLQLYQLKETVLLDPDDDGGVLVEGVSGTICALNRSGQLLACNLFEPTTSATLATHLTATFGVEEKIADADVESFLQQLGSVGFLRFVKDTARQEDAA